MQHYDPVCGMKSDQNSQYHFHYHTTQKITIFVVNIVSINFKQIPQTI